MSNNYKGMLAEQKQHLIYYCNKLGEDRETVTDIYFPTLEQLDIILNKGAEPYTQEWDENEVTLDDQGKVVFPSSLLKLYDTVVKSHKGLRFYDSVIPEEYGGLGFSAMALGSMLERIGFTDLSLNGTLTLTTTLIEALSLDPNKELSDKFIPLIKNGSSGFVAFTEPGAGSNLKNIKTTSHEEGDFFVVKGVKIFITNAGFADVGIILAKNIINDKEDGTNAFMVYLPEIKDADDNSKLGIRATKLEKKLGIHASPTGVLEINALIPKKHIIGIRGKGYQTVLERLAGMRMGVAFQGSAVAERAYQMANDYANERIQFGKRISSFPAIDNKLRGMELNLTRMRKFAFEGSYALSKSQRNQSLKPSYLKLSDSEFKTFKEYKNLYNKGMLNYSVSKAKLYNTEIAFMIVDDALQIFGGNGFITDYKIEKLFRDCRILRIFEGTSEIQEGILNRTKGLAFATNMNELTQVAMNPKGFPNPEFFPLDYQDILFRRFSSVMDVYLNDDGEPKFLYDD